MQDNSILSYYYSWHRLQCMPRSVR